VTSPERETNGGREAVPYIYPLHLAAENGHVETVTALLDLFHADANIRDSDGNNALHRLIMRPHRKHSMRNFDAFTATAAALIKYGVSFEECNEAGQSAVALATANGYPKILKLLLAEGAQPPSSETLPVDSEYSIELGETSSRKKRSASAGSQTMEEHIEEHSALRQRKLSLPKHVSFASQVDEIPSEVNETVTEDPTAHGNSKVVDKVTDATTFVSRTFSPPPELGTPEQLVRDAASSKLSRDNRFSIVDDEVTKYFMFHEDETTDKSSGDKTSIENAIDNMDRPPKCEQTRHITESDSLDGKIDKAETSVAKNSANSTPSRSPNNMSPASNTDPSPKAYNRLETRKARADFFSTRTLQVIPPDSANIFYRGTSPEVPKPDENKHNKDPQQKREKTGEPPAVFSYLDETTESESAEVEDDDSDDEYVTDEEDVYIVEPNKLIELINHGSTAKKTFANVKKNNDNSQLGIPVAVQTVPFRIDAVPVAVQTIPLECGHLITVGVQTVTDSVHSVPVGIQTDKTPSEDSAEDSEEESSEGEYGNFTNEQQRNNTVEISNEKFSPEDKAISRNADNSSSGNTADFTVQCDVVPFARSLIVRSSVEEEPDDTDLALDGNRIQTDVLTRKHLETAQVVLQPDDIDGSRSRAPVLVYLDLNKSPDALERSAADLDRAIQTEMDATLNDSTTSSDSSSEEDEDDESSPRFVGGSTKLKKRIYSDIQVYSNVPSGGGKGVEDTRKGVEVLPKEKVVLLHLDSVTSLKTMEKSKTEFDSVIQAEIEEALKEEESESESEKEDSEEIVATREDVIRFVDTKNKVKPLDVDLQKASSANADRKLLSPQILTEAQKYNQRFVPMVGMYSEEEMFARRNFGGTDVTSQKGVKGRHSSNEQPAKKNLDSETVVQPPRVMVFDSQQHAQLIKNLMQQDMINVEDLSSASLQKGGKITATATTTKTKAQRENKYEIKTTRVRAIKDSGLSRVEIEERQSDLESDHEPDVALMEDSQEKFKSLLRHFQPDGATQSKNARNADSSTLPKSKNKGIPVSSSATVSESSFEKEKMQKASTLPKSKNNGIPDLNECESLFEKENKQPTVVLKVDENNELLIQAQPNGTKSDALGEFDAEPGGKRKSTAVQKQPSEPKNIPTKIRMKGENEELTMVAEKETSLDDKNRKSSTRRKRPELPKALGSSIDVDLETNVEGKSIVAPGSYTSTEINKLEPTKIPNQKKVERYETEPVFGRKIPSLPPMHTHPLNAKNNFAANEVALSDKIDPVIAATETTLKSKVKTYAEEELAAEQQVELVQNLRTKNGNFVPVLAAGVVAKPYNSDHSKSKKTSNSMHHNFTTDQNDEPQVEAFERGAGKKSQTRIVTDTPKTISEKVFPKDEVVEIEARTDLESFESEPGASKKSRKGSVKEVQKTAELLSPKDIGEKLPKVLLPVGSENLVFHKTKLPPKTKIYLNERGIEETSNGIKSFEVCNHSNYCFLPFSLHLAHRMPLGGNDSPRLCGADRNQLFHQDEGRISIIKS